MVYCYYCRKKIPCGYRKDLHDFSYCCNRCKNSVFTKNAYLKEAILKQLDLPADTELTAEFLHENFSEILLKSKHDFVFIKAGDNE